MLKLSFVVAIKQVVFFKRKLQLIVILIMDLSTNTFSVNYSDKNRNIPFISNNVQKNLLNAELLCKGGYGTGQ